MLERRPDLCAALYEDLWRSRFGEEDATNQSAYPLPVWGVRDGKFTSHYSRTYIKRRSASRKARCRGSTTGNGKRSISSPNLPRSCVSR